MSDLGKLIDKLEAEAEQSGGWEALILEERIRTLLKDNASEAPHVVFLDVCKYGLDSLKDYQDNPADSPAASLLLKYLQFAFSRYLSADEKAKTNVEAKRNGKSETANRRKFLAEAFGLTGLQGKRITLQQRQDIHSAFSNELDKLSHDQDENSLDGRPTKKNYTAAKRVAYKAHFGRDWVSDDETSKSNMETIVEILRKDWGQF